MYNTISTQTFKKVSHNLFLAILSLISSHTVIAQQMDWVNTTGSSETDVATSVTVDKAGNIFATGWFSGTVDFDPGPAVYSLSSHGEQDVFITKLDKAGNLIWATSFGGNKADYGEGIVVSDSGYVYLTGRFQATVDFNPGTGSWTVAAAGQRDIFVVKLDSLGQLVWAKTMGGVFVDEGKAIALGPNDCIFVIGQYQGTAQFDSIAGNISLTSSGNYDIFIQKLNPAGQVIWAKSMGGNAWDQGSSIAVDSLGNIYSTGSFQATADFNPNGGVLNKTAVGLWDFFVHKMDTAGVVHWVRTIGSNSLDQANAIEIDHKGDAYVAGIFSGSVDFDPSPSNYVLNTLPGARDAFLLKLDSNGDFQWAKSIGSQGYESGHSVAIDTLGNVYLGGRFQYTIDFDPGPDSSILTASGQYDIFIQKMDVNGGFEWVLGIGGSSYDYVNEMVLDHQNALITAGGFWTTVDFDPDTNTYSLTSLGKNDIFVQKFVLCESFVQVDSVSVCPGSSYTFPDEVFLPAVTDIVYHTSDFKTTQGCDSLIQTILIPDLIYSRHEEDTICYGQSYTFPDGSIITNVIDSTTHVSTLSSFEGCDSIIRTQIYVGDVNLDVEMVDRLTLKALATNASFQWVDCGNGYAPLFNATDSIFSPPVNGSYAVVISQNGCSDTSVCFDITTVNAEPDLEGSLIQFSPNPVKDFLQIDFGQVWEDGTIILSNLQGQLVFRVKISHQDKYFVDMSNFPDGIYLILFQAKGAAISRRIVKQ